MDDWHPEALAAIADHQIPLDIAGLDHRLYFGRIGAGKVAHLDAGGLLERLEIRLLLCLLPGLPPQLAMRTSPEPLRMSGTVVCSGQPDCAPADRMTKGAATAAPASPSADRRPRLWIGHLPMRASPCLSLRLMISTPPDRRASACARTPSAPARGPAERDQRILDLG
jgi:hypothetical protein